MGNKEHRWRLHSSTFWNIHLISNSKRLGIFLGTNQVPTLYLDQDLLPLNSYLNRNLGGVQSANISCEIARLCRVFRCFPGTHYLFPFDKSR
jgi:hypothetical protein